MKRKVFIALLVLVVGVISTFAVRADLYTPQVTAAYAKAQGGLSSSPVISSVLFSYISTREEGSYLVLQGCVFLFLGSLWLKRARREKLLLETRSSGEAV